MAPIILDVDVRRKVFRSRAGPEHVVLADMRFSLAEREIVALVGPSGCGKTTLLRLIGRLDHDFEGRITWHGREAPRIGTVFQEPRLLPWRTVRENLLLVTPPDSVETVDELLRALGLWPHRDSYPTQISLGMARRASIARAFAIRPDIVLLDEPFVSLDPSMAERGRQVLLDAWQRRPTTGLLVTHDLLDAAALADRVLMLAGSPTRIVSEVVIPPANRRAGTEAAHAFAQELRLLRPVEPVLFPDVSAASSDRR